MTTKSTRRTARISQPKSKPIYEGVALARVYAKKTGAFLGYAARPSNPVDANGKVAVWYHVTRNAFGFWHCNCEAHGDCKHRDAVVAVEAIHDAEQAETPAVATEQPVAEAEIAPIETTTEQPAVASTELGDAATAQADELPPTPANVVAFQDRRRQITAPPGPPHRYDEPKGELHSNTQHRGGFVNALFGNSPEMAKYRVAYVAGAK